MMQTANKYHKYRVVKVKVSQSITFHLYNVIYLCNIILIQKQIFNNMNFIVNFNPLKVL